MTAFYNESDPAAAHVLRCLISENLIAPGHVDDRSIKDVQPDDLAGFDQCHFFAGAGLWSVAARLAGWPDDQPLWSGSAPCQPFSIAGKRAGVEDRRHLWPDLLRLIRARRPDVVVGEQVAGPAGYDWLDRVRFDLDGENYASRAVDIPACAVDSPQIRQRIYWVAKDLAHADRRGCVADGIGGSLAEVSQRGAYPERPLPKRGSGRRNGSDWADERWLQCDDDRRRRTEPGLCLLADGMAGRVAAGRLAGNGIVVPLAAEVIAAIMETIE